jgi:hypothetical protein
MLLVAVGQEGADGYYSNVETSGPGARASLSGLESLDSGFRRVPHV